MTKTLLFLCVLLTGCTGLVRGCSSFSAEQFGGNWLIAQYRMDGTVLNCWKLANVSVTNEHQSDGIYWKSSSGHLIHLSGWYIRVQVEGHNWIGAARDIGVALDNCME